MLEKIKNLYQKYAEIINYLIVGGLTTVVSLATKYALLFTILDAKNPLQLQISVVVSWIAAVAFAYVTNRKYVFKSKDKNILHELSLFVSARIATLVMESVFMWFFITLLKLDSDFYVIIWTLVSQVLVLIGNYVLSKFFVFKKKSETKKEKNVEKESWKKYILYFTIIFLVVLILVFGWYFFAGRTFIWSSAENINNSLDGYSQHYRAQLYYSKYLRGILKNILENHQLIIPNWNFNIGEGADILGTLNYYVIGDPFTFLSVLFPTKFMWFYYGLMIVLRLYLSGVSFSILCFKTGKKNKYAVLGGALTYMFCTWAIYNTNRHPFFLNPMVYFPLIILGIEKVIKKERPYLLIGMIFLSAISNFYFFYMIAIITAVYSIIRLMLLYKKDVKTIILNIIKIGCFSVLGILLSSIVFIPVCFTFLSDSRMSSDIVWHFIYPLSYYSILPSMLLSNNTSFWIFMGYSSPTILALFMLFRKRKDNVLLKVLFIICIIIVLVPCFGQFLNGMSYMCNRWCWALALLTAYILVTEWDNLINIDENNLKKIVIYTGIYTLICLIFSYSKIVDVFISICIALFTLFLISPIFNKNKDSKKMQKTLLLIIIVSIVINGFLENSIEGKNYASEALELKNLMQNSTKNETSAIKQYLKQYNDDIKKVRFSGRNLTDNANLTEEISSTQYYWTISNQYNSEYRRALELRENMAQWYEGYDDRTFLNTLAGVKYYVVSEQDTLSVPYGFKFQKIINKGDKLAPQKYKIYKNENYLSFLYAYNSYITTDEWEKLNAVQKQETMLQTAVVDKEINDLEEKRITLSSVNIPFTIKCNGNGISYENNRFIVTSTDSNVTINFNGIENAETYLSIRGLDYEPSHIYDILLKNKDEWDNLSYTKQQKIKRNKFYWTKGTKATLSFTSSNYVSKKIDYYNKENMYYLGRHDFSVNFNYSKDHINSITINFSELGTYSFDSIGIICQPMDGYKEQVEELKQYEIGTFNINTDNIECVVSVNEPKLLTFAIPYSKGWEAFVDGEKAEIIQTNIKNMGVQLNKGTHTIKLHYKTPLMKQGLYISLGSLIILTLYAFVYEMRKKKNKTI